MRVIAWWIIADGVTGLHGVIVIALVEVANVHALDRSLWHHRLTVKCVPQMT